MIPVYKPFLNQEILKYAHDALDSTWISSKGDFINHIESNLRKYHTVNDVRVNTALTTNNGTSAMHLAARLLKHQYPKIKQIIVPNNVYIAAWNAFLFDKNFELKAVEADPNTWNYNNQTLYELLDSVDIETTALLVVHNLGNIINVPKIKRDWEGLVIIEDNCEGFFGEYEGKPSGSESFASALSFFGNKNITSGEGGAIITENVNYGYLYNLRSQGQSNVRFIHNELGYNYRMTNVQAAILYGQFRNRKAIASKKEHIFNLYFDLLKEVDEITFQSLEENTKHSKWMFGVKVKNSTYNNLEEFFHSNYIDVRPMFYPINKHKHLKDILTYGDEGVAEKINKECVVLPSYPDLENHEISHIVNTLKQYLVKNK